MLEFFVGGVVLLALISLHYLWGETKKDIEDSINSGIRRDFHRRCEELLTATEDEANNIIIEFRNHWKPYVGYGQLNHYCQQLTKLMLQPNTQQ